MATAPGTGPGTGPAVTPVGGNAAQQAQTQQLVSTLVTVTRAMASFNTDLSRFVNQIKTSSKQAEDALKQEANLDKKALDAKSKQIVKDADDIIKQRKIQEDRIRTNRKQEALESYQFNLKSKYVDEIKKDLEFQQTKLKKQEQQHLASVKRIRELREELEKAQAPDLRKKLEAELEDQLKTHKGLNRGLETTTTRVTALSGAQGKQTVVAKMLSGGFRSLLAKTNNLISGFSAATAAMAAWDSTVTQSGTRETDTFGGMVQNWLGQLTSGVSLKVYDNILAQTRNIKLVGGAETQTKVIDTGKDAFFKYTGSLQSAAEATAAIIPGLQASGIGARDMSGTIDNLVPQFAKLSQATGESVAAVAKMSAGMMVENNTRALLRGTLKADRDQVLQRMLVRQQELALAGYSLEQTKEIQREEIRRKMGGTIRERAKDMAQMFAAIEMAIRQEADPTKRAKMQGDYDIMKQNRSAAMYGRGKEATDAQARMNEAQTRLANQIHEQSSAIQANTGYLNTQRVQQEYISDIFSKNMNTASAFQAPMKEATPKHQGDLTTESPLDGNVGEVKKIFDKFAAALTNPLVMGMLALATAIGASTVATVLLTRTLGKLKIMGGALDDLMPDDKNGKRGKTDKPRKGKSGWRSAAQTPSSETTQTTRERIVERAKSVLASGKDVAAKGVGATAEKGKAALEIGKDVAKNIPWKTIASASTAATGVGAIIRVAGANVLDPLLGVTGIGKDAAGKELQVDTEQDDKNWERFSVLEKTQSGFMRGLEKTIGFVGLDSISRQAEFRRVELETAYLKNLQSSTTQPRGTNPNRTVDGATALPTQATQQVLNQLNPTIIAQTTAQIPRIVSAALPTQPLIAPSIADQRIPPFLSEKHNKEKSNQSNNLEDLGIVSDLRTIVELLGKLNSTMETDAEIRRNLDDQLQFMMRKAGVEDRRPSRAYDQSRRHVGG